MHKTLEPTPLVYGYQWEGKAILFQELSPIAV